ncbi:MAG TPA: PilZ domain-containing protein [Nocardioides sp.]|nr:PilZ domain-containing protein [Nocardioides sp.]
MRHRASLAQYGLGLTLVLALVALTCYTAWTQLAGQRLVLDDRASYPASQRSHGDDRHADLEREIVREPPSDLGTGPRNLNSDLAVHAAGTAPTTVDGTTMALVVSIIAFGTGALAHRALARRLRRRRPTQDSQELEDDEVGTTSSSTDAASDGPGALDEMDPEGASVPVGPAGSAPEADADDLPEPEVARLQQGPSDGVDPPAPDSGGSGGAANAGPDLSMIDGSDAIAAVATGAGLSGTDGQDMVSRRSVIYDRRTHVRVPFGGRARLQWDGNDVACETVDLDAQGVRCFVPADGDDVLLPVGTPVRITLTIEGALLPAAARVTSSRPESGRWRVAVRFTQLPADHRALLLGFVDQQERVG